MASWQQQKHSKSSREAELLLGLVDCVDRICAAPRLIHAPQTEVEPSSAVITKDRKNVSRFDFLEALEWQGEVHSSKDGILSLGLVGGGATVERVGAAAPAPLDDRVGESGHGSVLCPVSMTHRRRGLPFADKH